MNGPPGHHDIRLELGGYVLGALEPRDRSRVEQHLQTCSECRREVAELAALPGLLGRADPAQAAPGGDAPPAATSAATAATAVIARARRRHRRGVVAAALVLAVAAVALTLRPVPDEQPGIDLAVVSADDPAVAGTAAVDATEWGMTISVELAGLPDRDGFVLWAVAGDGHRAQAASWRATPDGRVELRGSCYLQLERLDRLEVLTPDDELVATLAAS